MVGDDNRWRFRSSQVLNALDSFDAMEAGDGGTNKLKCDSITPMPALDGRFVKGLVFSWIGQCLGCFCGLVAKACSCILGNFMEDALDTLLNLLFVQRTFLIL